MTVGWARFCAHADTKPRGQTINLSAHPTLFSENKFTLGGVALRNAAAEARRILVERAAQKLGVPAAQLKVDNGVVVAGAQRVAYGDLIGGQYFHHKLEWNKLAGFRG